MRSLITLLAGVALGYALSGAEAAELRARLRVEQEHVESAKVAASEHYETFYGAFWLDFECPPLVGSRIPDAVKPIACTGRIRHYRSAALESARERAQSAGPGSVALLLEEKGPRERVLDAAWKLEIRR